LVASKQVVSFDHFRLTCALNLAARRGEAYFDLTARLFFPSREAPCLSSVD